MNNVMTTDHTPPSVDRKIDHDGFTLIEVLIVVVILGVISVVVVAAVGGFTAEAEDTGCSADAHTLYVATEAFFAQRNTSSIPPADSAPTRTRRRSSPRASCEISRRCTISRPMDDWPRP